MVTKAKNRPMANFSQINKKLQDLCFAHKTLQTDRYLTNGWPLSIKLYANRAAFSLLTKTPDKGYKLQVGC